MFIGSVVSVVPDAWWISWRELQNGGDGFDKASPILFFGEQLLATGFAEAIETCATIVFRNSPFGADPAFLFHAVQGGVERAFLDAEDIFRDALNVEGDAEAVHGTPDESLEDQEGEGALEDVGFGRGQEGSYRQLWVRRMGARFVSPESTRILGSGSDRRLPVERGRPVHGERHGDGGSALLHGDEEALSIGGNVVGIADGRDSGFLRACLTGRARCFEAEPDD